jgi:hypothetical protein
MTRPSLLFGHCGFRSRKVSTDSLVADPEVLGDSAH